MNYLIVPGLKYKFSLNSYHASEIIEAVCKRHKIDKSILLKKDRHRLIALPRMIAMHLITKYTTLTLREIGGLLNRDYTTVIHSKKTISNLMEVEPVIAAKVREIETTLSLHAYNGSE